MLRTLSAAALAIALFACAAPLAERGAPARVEVKIIAFNDFHGNLEPPKVSVPAPAPGEGSTPVPAGGVAYLASAIDSLRAANPNHVVVSAGDMIGASPLVSALFLDEPTIHAMNLIRLDLNAVGNHEFDRGSAELLRLQNGGCEKHTRLEPCQVDKVFPGARFRFLGANVLTKSGAALLPSYEVKSFGSGPAEVRVGFIGMTLKDTPALVTPAGIAGLSFADEAATANVLVPKLRAEGADAIVLLIHEGAYTDSGYNDKACAGLRGGLLEILERLDPAIDVVVSGHSHRSYVCDYGRTDPTRPFLLTSAGVGGTLVTDIRLSIDPGAGRVVAKSADNIIVQGEGFTGSKGEVAVSDRHPRFSRHPEVAALVARYAAAAAPLAARVVGRLAAPAMRTNNVAGEQVLGNLIADAQLAATRAPQYGGAEIAFMNWGGVRADLVPAADGTVTYGQLFAVHPFSNVLTVKSYTGAQIRAILEQQFDGGSNSVASPNILLPSSNFRYRYDLSRPPGQRILAPTVAGRPLSDETVYRVAISNFLASGGDNFTMFAQGRDVGSGPLDVDALEAYIAASSPLTPPAADRIIRLDSK